MIVMKEFVAVIQVKINHVHHRLSNFKGVVERVTHCSVLMHLTVYKLTHVHFRLQHVGILLQ